MKAVICPECNGRPPSTAGCYSCGGSGVLETKEELQVYTIEGEPEVDYYPPTTTLAVDGRG